MKILNHLLTIAAVAAAMSFIGCSHDIEMSNPGQGGAEGIPFTFTVESPSSSSAVQAITRSIKSDDVDGTSYDRLRAVWAAGDELSVMLDHDGTYTFSKATITKINSDSTHAAFTTTLDASAAVGDKVTVFYPTLTDKDSLVINYCGNWYNTPQDGTVASLAKLDPIMGSSTLATVSTAGATVAQNIKMDIPETDASNNNSFGSAYYGIKVQKIDTIKQRNFDSNGVLVSTDIKSIETVPLKVLKLTLSIQNKDTAKQDNNWYTKATFDPNTGNCKWTRDYFDDSITVVPKDGKATYDRLYMAVPKVNGGLTASFCAQDEDGFVYTCDKIIPAKGGNYYPVTLTMRLSTHVDMGDTIEWASSNVGGKDPEDYGDYFAWGEVKPKDVYYWPPTEDIEGAIIINEWRKYPYKYGAIKADVYKSYMDSGYDEETILAILAETTDESSIDLTKYNATDKKTILDKEDDAASVNMGGRWRMPRTEEIWRIANSSYYRSPLIIDENAQRVNRYGQTINGILITSRLNGNSMFFPDAGYILGDEVDDIELNAGAFYWGSFLQSGSGGLNNDGFVPENDFYYLCYGQAVIKPAEGGSWGISSGTNMPRCIGLPVRAVRSKANVTHIKM